MSAQHTGTDNLWGSPRVAEFLDIPVRNLDQWAYKGLGPKYFKVGRHRRYRPEDVQAWLAQQSGPRNA